MVMTDRQQFMNRNTDRINNLICRILLYTNFVFPIFLVTKYFNFYTMGYGFTVACWTANMFLSFMMRNLIQFNISRRIIKIFGITSIIIVINILGSNKSVAVNMVYVVPTFISCMYLDKGTIFRTSVASYIAMSISLFLKTETSFIHDGLITSNLNAFWRVYIGFSIEQVFVLVACIELTKILNIVITELQERTRQIQTLQAKEILTFANIVEARDKFSGEHIKRTSMYVRLLSEELSHMQKYSEVLTPEIIDLFANAAPLHDLGKIEVPDSILKKEGRLTEEEYEVMKKHSETGYLMINRYLTDIVDQEFLMYSEQMALHHHERYDGTGYPQGLEGESIPLCARIMAVADVLDALLSKRQYKESFSLEKAFDIMKKARGYQFDPDIIDCLERILPTVESIAGCAELEIID